MVQNVASSFVNRPAAVGLSLRSVRVRAKSLGVSGDGILTSKSQSVSESLKPTMSLPDLLQTRQNQSPECQGRQALFAPCDILGLRLQFS